MAIAAANRALIILLIAGFTLFGARAPGASEPELAGLVAEQIRPMVGPAGGVAVVLRAGGRTSFFNYGMADRSRAITSDVLFNLGSVAKVFDATLLAAADLSGELSLDDYVATHVTELKAGGDIARVTLRQLATYSSGFVLPQDHPPWPSPDESFTLPQFLARLTAWTADGEHAPGRQVIYSHAGYVLLHLVLERRFGMRFDQLMSERLTMPLGMVATVLPQPSADPEQNPRGELPQVLARRAVQGYAADGTPFGAPGDLQGYYHWLGTGQMYASARDMAVFLKANLGEAEGGTGLQQAMRRAQAPVLPINADVAQALAWEVRKVDVRKTEGRKEDQTIVEKFGGLYNAAAYIGLMPRQKIGIVILRNRGGSDIAEAGRAILAALPRRLD
jgi:beta-lactamase class C